MKSAAVAAALCLSGCLGSPPSAPPGGEADATPGGSCGTVRALRDDFESGLSGWRWGASGTEVSGGAARTSTGPNAFATMQSAAQYQVTGGQLVAEVDVSGLADAQFDMVLASPDGTSIRMRLRLDNLEIRVADGDGDRSVDGRPLQPDHRWWRLREQEGHFFWATSVDGEDWIEHEPFDASIGPVARVDLALLTFDETAAVAIHSVNPGESEGSCPAASFTDEFEAPSPRWQFDEQGDCQIDVEGRVELGYSAQAYCAITTRQRFDLRDSAFAVELAELFDCKPQPIMLVVTADWEEMSILCRDEGGVRKLVAASYTGPGEISILNYDPAKHDFVRLRHDREVGGVVFEAWPGDGSWSIFATLPRSPDGLAEGYLRFFLGGDTSGGFEFVALDSLNLAP